MGGQQLEAEMSRRLSPAGTSVPCIGASPLEDGSASVSRSTPFGEEKRPSVPLGERDAHLSLKSEESLFSHTLSIAPSLSLSLLNTLCRSSQLDLIWEQIAVLSRKALCGHL